MKLAIVGSRNFHDYQLFLKHVNEALIYWKLDLYDFEEIVSGGCRGTDLLAERLANDYNVKMTIFSPDWNKHGRAAGILRNNDIVNHANAMIAFPSKDSVGTYDSIRKAQLKQIPIVIVNI